MEEYAGYAEQLKHRIADTRLLLGKALDAGEWVLAMHLTNATVKLRLPLPETLPPEWLLPMRGLASATTVAAAS